MKKYIFLFLTTLCLSLSAFSQTVGITDFMRLNPYSNFNNPAYFIPYKGYLSVPPMVSNINVSVYNSGFRYDNLFKRDGDGKPVAITPNKFVNSLSKNNWLNTQLNFEVLGFGLKIDKHFFSFSYRLKIDERFRYSRSLFSFFLQNLEKDKHGDYLYTASSPALLEISPNLNVYQEVSLGFRAQIFDRLYVGIRPKILFGIVNVQTNRFGAKVYSDPEDYTIYGNYDVHIKMASVIPFYTKENGTITLNMEALDFSNYGTIVKNCFSQNLGFALDLGAVYRLSQKLRVSASITDVGFIRWKGSPLELKCALLPDGEYSEFSGFNAEQITDFITNGVHINLDNIFNSANNNFELNEINSYSTALTAKIMLDGYYDLTPSNRFILQLKSYVMGKYLVPQFTVAYNGTFFNIFDVVVSYSMLKKSFTNVGVGFGIRLGPVHLYAGTDNVFAAVNLLNTKRASATFGLLIDFPVKNVKEPVLNSLYKNNDEVQETQEPKPKKEKKRNETSN